MSTAIFGSYTQEGFVVAADGRAVNSDDPSKVKNWEQKIFDISGNGNHIACSFSGNIELTPEQSEDVVFDFRKAIVEASKDRSDPGSMDLHGYALRLSRTVNELLDETRASGNMAKFDTPPVHTTPEGSMIALAFLEGYYNGTPQRVDVKFWHKDQKLLEPQIVKQPVALSLRLIVGPPEICRLLFFTYDPRFAAYRRNKSGIPTLAEQVEICKKFILACTDPEAIKIDAGCSGIGGHIHVATITASDGFSWAVPPKRNP
jgi:hypothetical protein